jgi:sortase A
MKFKIAGIILFLIGISIIGTTIFMRAEGTRKQKEITKVFEETIGNVDKAEAIDAVRSEDLKPLVEDVDAIGIMIIPKIELKAAIGEGVDMETLKFALGHFQGTAMPGEKGNFCVAGHRSYTYNEFFNRLNEIETGDSIIVRTKQEEFTYKVYEKKVVEPTEVSVLNTTNDATITLVTCTPIHIATHRLIIKGRLENTK